MKKIICLILGHKFKKNEMIGWFCCRCNNHGIVDTLLHEIEAEKQLIKYLSKNQNHR